MKAERECKGCEGTGGSDPYCEDCSGPLDIPPCRSHCCTACRGTGRVVDHIPAADAVADAETLHTYAWDGGAEVGDLTPAYLDAAAVDLREDELLDDFAAPIAESAARAAFRAVPGLRD